MGGGEVQEILLVNMMLPTFSALMPNTVVCFNIRCNLHVDNTSAYKLCI